MMKNRFLAPATADFRKLPGYPSKDRMARGIVAVIECEQEIPCNPCETSCPQKAISVGDMITNLPVLDEDKCIGCGLCVAKCPGQAIFMLDMSASDKAIVGFPYEYLPLPQQGQEVDVVDRNGKILGKGKINKAQNSEALDKTCIVYVEVPKELGEEVRFIGRTK